LKKELRMSNSYVALRKNRERLSRRRKHIRKRVFGTAERPRLLMFSSNKHIYVQVVNDVVGKTLAGCSTLTPAVKDKLKDAKGNIGRAKIVGESIVELLKALNVTTICFDRNGKKYHGHVKALADAVRSGGMVF
jgi:large subunit ribosomal protein L18